MNSKLYLWQVYGETQHWSLTGLGIYFFICKRKVASLFLQCWQTGSFGIVLMLAEHY